MVLREAGIECQPEKTCFTAREYTVHDQRHVVRAGGHVDDQDTPDSLGDKQSAIGRELQRPRDAVEIVEHRVDAKLRSIARRERIAGRRCRRIVRVVVATGLCRHGLRDEREDESAATNGCPHAAIMPWRSRMAD